MSRYSVNGVSWDSSESNIYWTDNVPNIDIGKYCFEVGKDKFIISAEDSIRDFKYISISTDKGISANGAKQLKDIPAGAFMSFIKRNIFGNEILIPVCKVNKLPKKVYGNIDEAMSAANNIVNALKQLESTYIKPENSSISDTDRYEIYVDKESGAEFWFNKCYGTYSGSYSNNFLFRPVILAFLSCIPKSELDRVSREFWEDVNQECTWSIGSESTKEADNDTDSNVEPEPIVTEEKEYTGSAIDRLNQRNAESF